MIDIVVVLPAPLGPRSPKISPSLTVKSTPASAWTSPNDFASSRTSIMRLPPGPGLHGAARYDPQIRR